MSRSHLEVKLIYQQFFVRLITTLSLDQFTNYFAHMFTPTRRCVARQTQVRTFKVTPRGQTYLLAISCPAHNYLIPRPIHKLLLTYVDSYKAVCHMLHPRSVPSRSRSHIEVKLICQQFLFRLITILSLDQFTNYFSHTFTPTRRCVTCYTQVRTFKVKVTHRRQTYLLAISCPAHNLLIP